MPKRPKKVVTEMYGDEEEEKPKDQEVDSEDQGLEEAVRDFADGSRLIKIYRYKGPLGGRPDFLGGVSPENYNEFFIQEHFGGGKFFGRWKDKKGAHVRHNFDIAGPQKDINEQEARTREDGEEEEGRYDYLNRGPQQQQQQGSQQINMADVLRLMAESRREAREEIRSILELTMRNQQPQQDLSDKVLSVVEKIVPLIQSGGGGGETGGWAGVIMNVVSQLKEPISKVVDAVTKGPVQPVTAPGPGPVSVRPGPMVTAQPSPYSSDQPVTMNPNQLKSEGEMLADSFKDMIPMYVKAANEDKDVGVYADMILENVPSFGYPRLHRWLMTPGCLDDLAKFAPIIATDQKQREWWKELQKQLVLALNEELGRGDTDLQPESNSDAPASRSTHRPEFS